MSADLSRLSCIDTLWSVVRRAHNGSDETVRSAQQLLFDRYGGAVRRYLRASLRDEDAAEDVFQEFSLRFLRGDFRSANPERGRFRNFVKTSLYHLVVDYYRSSARRPNQLTIQTSAITDDRHVFDEESFHRSWRQELLNRSWAALAEAERGQGTPFCSALRLLVDHPDWRSNEIAQQLSLRSGRRITSGNVRVVIHRARKLFVDALANEVRESLDAPTVDEMEQELIDLNLLDYCRSALVRFRELEEAIRPPLPDCPAIDPRKSISL